MFSDTRAWLKVGMAMGWYRVVKQDIANEMSALTNLYSCVSAQARVLSMSCPLSMYRKYCTPTRVTTPFNFSTSQQFSVMYSCVCILLFLLQMVRCNTSLAEVVH